MLQSLNEWFLYKLIDRRQSASDGRWTYSGGHPRSFPINVECVRCMTRKFARPTPAGSSFGLMLRFQQLSFGIGIIRSVGHTQAPSSRNNRQCPPGLDLPKKAFGQFCVANGKRGLWEVNDASVDPLPNVNVGRVQTSHVRARTPRGASRSLHDAALSAACGL